MNPGIIRKTTRDTLWLLVIVTVAIILFETLLVGMIGEFSQDISAMWLQKPIFQHFARMLVGAEFSADITPTAIITIGSPHPLLYAMIWSFLLAGCTRVIAGEIDRGTADLLLTLPVSRSSVYVSVSVVWFLAGVPVCLATLIGIWVGQTAFPLWEGLDFLPLTMLTVNLFALYLAVGGAALLASALVSRRGPAVAFVLAWLLASFLLNYLGQLLWAAKQIAFLGILHYHRPLPIIQARSWPIGDVAVLVGFAVVVWSLGLWRFARRDIPAA